MKWIVIQNEIKTSYHITIFVYDILIKLSNFNNDINNTIRTADEFLKDVIEKQRREHQTERNNFVILLQNAIREGIKLSQESFSNGDKYTGEKYAFQVEQLRFMLKQFS